jgi:hypothetical protein
MSSPQGSGLAGLGGFGQRGHAQLAVGAGKVGFDSAAAKEQRDGDLPVGVADGQGGDTLLGRGQLQRRPS